MNSKAQQLAELVLIYFTKEELHLDEEAETEKEMLDLARDIEKSSTICTDCNGTGERSPDGKDSMASLDGVTRWRTIEIIEIDVVGRIWYEVR